MSRKIINGLRPNMLGDIIVSLPHLNFLEKKYSGSYKLVCISPKCKQIVPLLLNHPLINNIYITKENESYSDIETQLFNQFDEVYDLFAPVVHPEWFNHVNIHEASFLMNRDMRTNARRTQQEWADLDDKYPKLNKWFNTSFSRKTIGLIPESGYNNGDSSISLRSPNPAFWKDLTEKLTKSGFRVIQYGLPNQKLIPGASYSLGSSLFDMIKDILGCDIVIGTDSGSMHILGAYGMRQICLYTNYLKNHTRNFGAFVPKNFMNNLIAIRGENGNINNIESEKVLEAVGVLK